MKKMLLAAAATAALALASAVPACATPVDYPVGPGAVASDTAWLFAPASATITDAFASDPSWSIIDSGDHWLEIGGDSVTNILVTATLDYAVDPFAFDFFAFDGPNLVFARQYGIAGGLGTSFPISDPESAFDADLAARDPNSGAVPEPMTLALLGAGLAGLGFTRRKKLAS